MQIGIGGCFYKLIKSLYSTSSCDIKIGQKSKNWTTDKNNLRSTRANCKYISNTFHGAQGFAFLVKLRRDPFITQSRGVRQGCISSPFFSNLYINDLPFAFENILSDPIVIPNGTKLNSLLSRSKTGLQNCLNSLSSFSSSWMLEVNFKRTKIMIFQKRARKFTDNFYIGKDVIDLVHEYTYLGSRIYIKW